MDKSFLFNFPVDIYKDSKKNWRIKGLASTEDKDLQGEIIKQNGLDLSALKAGKGYLNWEHKNDPANIVGLIDNAEITSKGLMIEGQLFKKHDQAKAIQQIMSSLDEKRKNRIQLSVEGKVLEKEKSDDGKGSTILRAKISAVALTLQPVNENTFASLVKSLTAKTEESKCIGYADIDEVFDYLSNKIKKSNKNIFDILKCLRNKLSK